LPFKLKYVWRSFGVEMVEPQVSNYNSRSVWRNFDSRKELQA
jgi:hypothetical protein